jgi:DNA mismatch repair ATPase MutL
MSDIVERLFSSTNPYRCPHGRPIILTVDLAGIERGVGRRK